MMPRRHRNARAVPDGDQLAAAIGVQVATRAVTDGKYPCAGCRRRGIGFTVVRICEGTRHTERAIKNAGGAVRYCPACTPHPRNGHWSPLTSQFLPRSYANPTGSR